jgi:DNA (cytosine-5)-methyltransferase 1
MGILALDIFCGAGGVTYGLRKAGIRVLTGVDKQEDCRLTYTQNNPSVRFLSADVRTLKAKELFDGVNGTVDQNDFLLLAACAPCQPFSKQNRFKDRAQDRAVLRHVERLLVELRPDFLFLENVQGLQKIKGYSAFRRFQDALCELRYQTRCEVIDGVDYGIPQHRRRLVLTASLHGKAPWPSKVHGNGPNLQPYLTVRDAIAKYPPLSAGQEHPIVPNHVTAKIMEHNLERLRATPLNGGSRSDWSLALTLTCHKRHEGHPDVYGRLRWDAPAPTLTTRCTSLSNGRYGHPEQDRAISAREAAALQGFGDDFIFYGKNKQITRQIGNAVPPVVAQSFGSAFLEEATSLKKPRKGSPWHSLLAKQKTSGFAFSTKARRGSNPAKHYRE